MFLTSPTEARHAARRLCGHAALYLAARALSISALNSSGSLHDLRGKLGRDGLQFVLDALEFCFGNGIDLDAGFLELADHVLVTFVKQLVLEQARFRGGFWTPCLSASLKPSQNFFEVTMATVV